MKNEKDIKGKYYAAYFDMFNIQPQDAAPHQKINFSFISKMISFGGNNFIFSNITNPMEIGDTSYIYGCYPSLINLEARMNVEDYVCIKKPWKY